MQRTYTIKSDNPIIDGTTVTIRGKGLAEIKIKADRILSNPANRELVPCRKGVKA
jgi:hypothetical protein